MRIAELLLLVQNLDRSDKRRLMQFLVNELAKEEDGVLTTEGVYPIWSPYASFEAANALLAARSEDTQNA